MSLSIHRASEVTTLIGSGETRHCRCGEPLQFAARYEGPRLLSRPVFYTSFYWCRVCDQPPPKGSKK